MSILCCNIWILKEHFKILFSALIPVKGRYQLFVCLTVCDMFYWNVWKSFLCGRKCFSNTVNDALRGGAQQDCQSNVCECAFEYVCWKRNKRPLYDTNSNKKGDGAKRTTGFSGYFTGLKVQWSSYREITHRSPLRDNTWQVGDGWWRLFASTQTITTTEHTNSAIR